jgi:hypothetical protein
MVLFWWSVAYVHASGCSAHLLLRPNCAHTRCLAAGADQRRMEVDWSPVDERKEGGDGALLRAGEHADGDSADLSLQPPHGQTQIPG